MDYRDERLEEQLAAAVAGDHDTFDVTIVRTSEDGHSDGVFTLRAATLDEASRLTREYLERALTSEWLRTKRRSEEREHD